MFPKSGAWPPSIFPALSVVQPARTFPHLADKYIAKYSSLMSGNDINV